MSIDTSENPSETRTQAFSPAEIFLHGPGEGRHLHVLNNLATIKTVAGTQSMAVVEFSAPKDFGPPVHSHRDEDELLYVLDGELDVQIDGEWRAAPAGSFAWLPRQVPHTFQVTTDTARMLSVTTASTGDEAATFDQMMAALGTDVAEATIPAPVDIDPGTVAQVCSSFGVDVLGPPPAPRS